MDMTEEQMLPSQFERSDECPRIFESYGPENRGQGMADSELFEGQQQGVDEIIADKFDGKLSMGTRILASAIHRNRTSWNGKEPKPLMRKLEVNEEHKRQRELKAKEQLLRRHHQLFEFRSQQFLYLNNTANSKQRGLSAVLAPE